MRFAVSAYSSHIVLMRLHTLLFWSQISSVSSLVFPFSAPPPPAPIHRVAIIGTGIAGLSLAHALENCPDLAEKYTKKGGKNREGIEVSLFDSRPSLDFEAGAGIQLNGGMSVLRKINPELQRDVAEASLPMAGVRSRTKHWWDDEAPFHTLFEFGLGDLIRKAGGEAEEELIVDGEVMAYTIMRGALQEVLMDKLPSGPGERVHFSKKLTGIRPSAVSGGGVFCEFSDESEEGPFDLIVGCDGIKSAVKEYIETDKISNDASSREGQASLYSGLRIEYAVKDGDSSSPPAQSSTLTQYFGDGAYAIKGTYGAGVGKPPIECAFVTFPDKNYIGPFKKSDATGFTMVKENDDWTQDVRVDARADLLKRVNKAQVPTVEIGPVIENANRFFDLGVYFHNPFSFSGWSREVADSGKYCTLAGDAAHAMPPFLGQGSNQAVQDAYCLATKIFEHNANVAWAASGEESVDEEGSQLKDLKTLLKEYENRRWWPTASITAKASFLGYVEASGGIVPKFRDVFFVTMWVIGVVRRVFLDAAVPRV